jgi:hypothetical protein
MGCCAARMTTKKVFGYNLIVDTFTLLINFKMKRDRRAALQRGDPVS